jgi:hypothetical protein
MSGTNIYRLVPTKRPLFTAQGKEGEEMLIYDPLPQRITITTADTEQSLALRMGTKGFILSNEGLGLIKLSYTAGTSGTQYTSIYPGAVFSICMLGDKATTLYFQSPLGSKVFEILSWL